MEPRTQNRNRFGIGIRIAFIMLIASTLPGVSHAQTKKMTLDKNDATVSEVLAAIKQQTDLSLVYNVNDLDLNRRLSVRMSDADVREVLDHLFAGTNITYVIDQSHIILSKKKTETSQGREIRGVVRDANGTPLIGVTAMVEGTTRGTTTTTDGSFTLNASSGETVLFSYLGYEPKSVQVTASDALRVVLDDASTSIDEVVVTALGIRRAEKALSYNVQTIKSEELTTVKDANFVNSLAGKVAGLTINSSSTGIGGASRVVMRGTRSITKDNNALYVIDGIPMVNVSRGELAQQKSPEYSAQPGGETIADINPDDIESLTVLVGGVAAALYGSDAANGAIIITTKKGRVGKPQVIVSNQTTFSEPFILPLFQYEYGNATDTYGSWGDRIPGGSTFDARDFFNTAINSQTSVSISGGSEKNQTYLSLSNTAANGIMPTNTFGRNTINFRNTSYLYNDKLVLDMSAMYTEQNDRNMIAQGLWGNPLVSLYTFPRGENFDDARMFETYDTSLEFYKQNWQWGAQAEDMQNPYWVLHRNPTGNERKRTMLNFSAQYKIADWIDVVGRLRIDQSNNVMKRKYYATSLSVYADENGKYREENQRDAVRYADLMVNINKTWCNWSLGANVGAIIKDSHTRLVGAHGNLKLDNEGGIPNFFSIQNIQIGNGKGYLLTESVKTQEQSVFGNFELGWKSMLFLTGTYRVDWPSQLANTGTASYAYPSVGFSGLVHEMFKLPEFVSYLKFRGSFAALGLPIPTNASIRTYEYDTRNGLYTLPRVRYWDYRPEKTDTWEVGLEARFLKNRLSLEATYYKSETSNQTFEIEGTATSGAGSTWLIQTGNVQNQGVELALGYQDRWGSFGWDTRVTAGFNENRILELVDGFNMNGEILTLDEINPAGTGSLQFFLHQGGTMGDLWTTSKLASDQNGYIYVNPDTYELALDDDKNLVGSVFPKWNLGWNNGFTYKKVRLSALFTARLGGVVASPTQAILDGYGVTQATVDARNAGGIPVNNGMYDAEQWYRTIGSGKVYSYYTYSATNVRLSEVSLGYTLPAKWFRDKLSITASAVGKNLWMIYCKAPFDPELTASTGTYFQGIDIFMQPSLRSVGFNVQVKF